MTLLHDSARYDGNLDPHHHVVCVRCHRIRDLEITGLRQIVETDAVLDGFTPLGWSLEIQALCDRCRRKEPGGRAARKPDAS